MNTMQNSYDHIEGLVKMVAIPKSHIDTIVVDNDKGRGKVYLKSTSHIINLPVEANKAFNFTESMSEEEGGDVYDVKILGYVDNENNKNRELIRFLEVGLWILLFVDASGIMRCAGSENIPLRCFTSKNLKKSTGVNIEFSAKEFTPAFIVENDEDFII